MAVAVDSGASLTANIADNLCRWDGQNRGHYEAWFLTLNQRVGQRGFWFRYTFEAPAAGASPPHAGLWATVFDRTRPEGNFGIVREYPAEAFSSRTDDFRLHIEDASLSA